MSSQLEFSQYLDNLSGLESSRRYDITNQFGYAGKYQFGGSLLQDIGMLDNSNYNTDKTVGKNVSFKSNEN